MDVGSILPVQANRYGTGSSDNFYVRDGLVLLNEKVIDDRNQSGDTLGKRRLQTPHKLVRLSKAYEEFFSKSGVTFSHYITINYEGYSVYVAFVFFLFARVFSAEICNDCKFVVSF